MMVDFDIRRSVLQPVRFSLLPEIELFVKRDDLIHPVVSGNKWRKLKHHIEHFRALDNRQRIVTFGGAYSNHLVATACASAVLSISATGIVRGEELDAGSNPVLRFCDLYGMDLRFVNREQYKAGDPGPFEESIYIIPEGGAGALGAKGCAGIMDEISEHLDHLFTGVGTGTTMAGLLMGAKGHKVRIEGVSAVGNGGYLKDEIAKVSGEADPILHTNFHGGGFARLPGEMLEVGKQFITETGILLDPVYTIKVVFAIVQLYRDGYFSPGSKVGLLHTGGLTGWFS